MNPIKYKSKIQLVLFIYESFLYIKWFKFRKFKIEYKKEHRDFRMSRNFCNFEVPTKKYKSLMPNDKGTNVFSEIGKFFKEKDGTSAMNAIMDMMDAPQPVGKEAVRD